MTFKLSTIADSTGKVQWIDCTFRDGGYYTKWDFPSSLVDSYLTCCAELGIDIVELGFRTPPSDIYLGAHAFTTEEFINTFTLPEGLKIAVMINASDYLEKSEKLLFSFPEMAAESKVSFVRIATHRRELDRVAELITVLRERGYSVILNIMQCSEIDQAFLAKAAELLNSLEVEAIYFADSTGSAVPSDIYDLINFSKDLLRHPLGIHAHDNMGFALANSLSALEAGATWVDTTVMGMGRGPGNAKTEEFCNVIRRNSTEALSNLMEYIDSQFSLLKNKYKWGTNPLYFLAGRDRVHPTYVQRMMSDGSFTQSERAQVLAQLGNTDSMSFDDEQLQSARYGAVQVSSTRAHRSFGAEMENRALLLIGGGESVKAYVEHIARLSLSERFFVVAFNTVLIDQNEIDIDARIVTDEMRALADCEVYRQISCSLWLSKPVSRIFLERGICVDDMLVLEDFEGETPVSPTQPTQTLDYALQAGLAGGIGTVYLLGFDGYDDNEAQHRHNNASISKFDKIYRDGIYTLTPTKYQINTRSMFGKLL